KMGHASGVLTQSHGPRQHPIGYSSCMLDPVARGGPSCLRAVFAASALLNKTNDFVLGHKLTVLAPHDIAAILNQVQPKHLSCQRLSTDGETPETCVREHGV
ncbi:pol, partial, partial [Pelobates cultripes]